MGDINLPAPLVTVTVPCFNYAHLVGATIESIKNQTLSNFECFVVNDGSTDDSERVILEAIKDDRRFHYAYLRNSGVSVARNHGISLGTAPFITCLDADDQIAPTFLETFVPYLQADNSLGLVYGGLKLLIPRKDGSITEHGSLWPNECDFDEHVKGENQVPTCCMYRRACWERLGGYRQRYGAELGCGTEDAEFWLRIGASGWDMKQVTKEPLFIYMLGGRTSDKSYKEVNWLQWHPWTVDERHPFASIATPKRLSHPVRQYDNPLISVVIPVGPGHEHNVTSAIDSLEAQTFRKWEAIIVDDTGGNELDLTPFPFVKLVKTEGGRGPGYARNRGADIARGRFLLFLDADDWLYPEALEVMLTTYAELDDEAAVYGDHVGLAIIDEEYARQVQREHRLLEYRPDDGYAVIRHFNPEYDWVRASQQPDKDGEFYIWCYITTLIPKSWHEEVGGFDEGMESWEDWDYWLRMARLGKCFVHVSEPLLVYQFYTGHRRESAHPGHEKGRQVAQSLVQYMRGKYQKGDKAVPCAGCGGRKGNRSPGGYPSMINAVSRQGINTGVASSDSDFVLCEYLGMPPGNISQHSVVGVTVFDNIIAGIPMVRRGNGWSIDYGYKAAGDRRFLVHKRDADLSPNWFKQVESERKDFESVLPKKKMSPKPPPEPKPMAEVLGAAVAGTPAALPSTDIPGATTVDEIQDGKEEISIAEAVLGNEELQALPGVTPNIAKQLDEAGVTSYQEILEMGTDGLREFKGVGPTRAELIVDAIRGLAAK